MRDNLVDYTVLSSVIGDHIRKKAVRAGVSRPSDRLSEQVFVCLTINLTEQ